MRHRLADGFRDRKTSMFAASRLGKLSHVALRLDDYFRHHSHRFAGIHASGSFGGKHQRVGTIENRIGHITGLRTRGTRVLDHRFQHLGGDDHRLPPLH